MARSGGDIRVLTGLRFFAALAVVLAHMPYTHADPRFRGVARFLAEGFVGVPFFFVLSGFVLTFAYHDRFRTLRPGPLRRYFASRVARIYPLHWLTLGLVIAFPFVTAPEVGGPGFEALRLALNAVLLQGFVPDPAYSVVYNGVAWTLSCEVFFYLLLPLLLRASRRWAGRPAAPLLAAGVVAAYQFGLAYVSWRNGRWLTLLVHALPVPVWHLPEFLVGVLLGQAFVARRTAGLDPAPSRPRWGATVAELAAVLALAGLVAVSGRFHLWYRLNGLYTPVMAVIVWVFARERGHLSRLLAGRVCVFLGEASFSLYMLHCLVLTRTIALAPGGLGPEQSEWLGLLAAIGLSAVCYRCYESPLRLAVTRLLGGRNMPRPAPVPAAAERRAA